MKKSALIAGIIIILAGGVFFAAQGILRGKEGEDKNEKEPLKKLSNLTLQDYAGNSVSFSDFLGTPLVINAWAAWCPFCRKELPDFAEIQKEFEDRVVIIAVNRAEPLATAKKYSDDLGATSDLIFLLDPEDSFYSAIGGFIMPETIFIDRDGFIREHKRGQMGKEEIRRRIEQLLSYENPS